MSFSIRTDSLCLLLMLAVLSSCVAHRSHAAERFDDSGGAMPDGSSSSVAEGGLGVGLDLTLARDRESDGQSVRSDGDDSLLEPIILSRRQAARLDVLATEPSFFTSSGGPRAGLPQPAFSDDDAAKVFRSLCRHAKPIHRVSQSVLFVVPSPPKGIPLDQAASWTSTWRSQMLLLVSHFYDLMAFQKYWVRLAVRDENSGSFTARMSGGPFLLVADDSSIGADKIVADLKARNHVEPLRIGSPDSFADILAFESTYHPLLIRTGGRHPQWIMTVVAPDKFFGPVTRQAGSPAQLLHLPDGFHEAVPMELYAITEHFALSAIPSGQYQAWRDLEHRRNGGDFTVSLDPTSDDGSGYVPTSKALAERQAIFRSYFVANTKIQMSPTHDGQVFAVRLSLNSEPLCRLGRRIDDLTSK